MRLYEFPCLRVLLGMQTIGNLRTKPDGFIELEKSKESKILFNLGMIETKNISQ